MEELRDELEKVKRRRQEREREKAARDEEMALMQREKESELFSVKSYLIFSFYYIYYLQSQKVLKKIEILNLTTSSLCELRSL